MRRKILSAGIALILLAVLCSCGGKAGYLHPERYGEEFRRHNEVLFFNEACEHSFVYVSAAGFSDTVDPNCYHAVKCNRDNCGYEAQLAPHVLDPAYLAVKTEPQYMDNGYLYHRVVTDCRLCGLRVILYVYCPIQDKECTAGGEENRCLFGCDWGELLCDTPYEIFSG